MRLLAFFVLALPALATDLLIQGALDWELRPLIAALENRKEVRLHAWTFWTGEIAGKSVVVSRTGIGPINAAAATTLGIEHFAPKAVINQGTAGGHNPDLHLYDIVIGEKTVDYSAFESERAGAGKGTDTARWKPSYHSVNGTVYRGFPGDSALLAAALRVKYDRGKLFRGTIGSAYQYNRELDHISWLRKTYGTDSEDMESAYSAGVAAGMGVPFLAIRILSDTEWTHPKLEIVAGQYCAEFVLRLIRSSLETK